MLSIDARWIGYEPSNGKYISDVIARQELTFFLYIVKASENDHNSLYLTRIFKLSSEM